MTCTTYAKRFFVIILKRNMASKWATCQIATNTQPQQGIPFANINSKDKHAKKTPTNC